MIELRTVTPADWRIWRELRLTALAEAPEAFGSRLALRRVSLIDEQQRSSIAITQMRGTAGLPDRAVSRRLSQLWLRLGQEAQ